MVVRFITLHTIFLAYYPPATYLFTRMRGTVFPFYNRIVVAIFDNGFSDEIHNYLSSIFARHALVFA